MLGTKKKAAFGLCMIDYEIWICFSVLFILCSSTEFKQSISVHSEFVFTPAAYCLENVTCFVCGMENSRGVSRHLTWEMDFNSNLVPRVSLLCLHCRWEKTLVDSGHVSPRIWKVHQMCVRGWVAMQALSTLWRRESARNWFCGQMTIDKMFDGSILWTTHMEFDMKGKKLWSNRSDATENNLALFKFSPVWRTGSAKNANSLRQF